jgi:hypothetical protein
LMASDARRRLTSLLQLYLRLVLVNEPYDASGDDHHGYAQKDGSGYL